ncbi:MAG: acetate kinase [Pseudonocardia sp.]|nr:acetate kinase [Pseudonocardia sp.]
MIPVLVLNAGSSSLKYQLIDMDDRSVTASGLVERIGEDAGRLEHRTPDTEPLVEEGKIPDHGAALDRVLAAFERTGGLAEAPFVVGHRVVHGGDRFSGPTVVDDDVLAEIRDLVPLAPLHNPANIAGIEVARSRFPDTPQVAVFDTAFHASMPPRAWRYALPRALADRLQVRRYGFHGASHAYVARQAAEHLGRPLAELDLVTLHLGNGASATAVAGGRSVDTSMGLTPLGGLVMGTRSGDLDPGIIAHLHREGGLDLDEIDGVLNKESGLKGLAGSNDLREVHRRADAGDADAVEALEVFCYRIRCTVGAYAAALGRLDAVVFTAGIGENDADVRARVCGGLAVLGVRLDEARNAARSREVRTISSDDSAVAVLVVPTDEELEIAEQSLAVVRANG